MTSYKPEDYYNYRIQRAIETLDEIEKHIENQYWNTAVNRMYYACFYAVGALLVKNKIETSSHAGTRQKFGQLFVRTGQFDPTLAKHYTRMFEKRQKGDYSDFYDFNEELVKELLPMTKEFIEAIKELIKE